LRSLLQNGFPRGEIVQAESILITQRLKHFTQREINASTGFELEKFASSTQFSMARALSQNSATP
jgi:hypothetical protein